MPIFKSHFDFMSKIFLRNLCIHLWSGERWRAYAFICLFIKMCFFVIEKICIIFIKIYSIRWLFETFFYDLTLFFQIVQNFKLEYDHDPIEPVLNTVMTPDRPLVLKFIPRS